MFEWNVSYWIDESICNRKRNRKGKNEKSEGKSVVQPFFLCHSHAYCKLNIFTNDTDRSIVLCIYLMVQNIIYLASKSVALSEQNKLIVGEWECEYTMARGNRAPDWVSEFLCIHVCLFNLWDWNVKGHRTHIKIGLMTDTHVFLYVVCGWGNSRTLTANTFSIRSSK